MLKTITAAILTLFGASSALAAGNCTALYPAEAAQGEFLTVKFPTETANGPASVVVFASQENARIGGSATNVRWCKSSREHDAAEYGIVYAVTFSEGKAKIPVASGAAWIRVFAGNKNFDVHRNAGEAEIAIASPPTADSEKSK